MSASAYAKEPKGTRRKQRIAFDLSPSALKELDELLGLADVPTRAELVRRALKLYGWLLKRQHEGDHVIVRSEKGDRETQIELF